MYIKKSKKVKDDKNRGELFAGNAE